MGDTLTALLLLTGQLPVRNTHTTHHVGPPTPVNDELPFGVFVGREHNNNDRELLSNVPTVKFFKVLFSSEVIIAFIAPVHRCFQLATHSRSASECTRGGRIDNL